jgi:hypothetical protein
VAKLAQQGRCVILYVTIFVDDGINVAYDFRKLIQLSCEPFQGRVGNGVVNGCAEKSHYLVDGFQEPCQVKHPLSGQKRPFGANGLERPSQAVKVIEREGAFRLQDAEELVGLVQAGFYLFPMGVEVHGVHMGNPEGAGAMALNFLPDGVKSYFLFKIIGIYH